jgi:hypothetical protein
VFELSFACPPGPVTLGNDYLMDQDPLAQSICAIDGDAHVFRKGAVDRLVGTPPSRLELLFGFVELGAEHVLGGVDHVLFVLSLLLGAASAMVNVPGRALRSVAWLVTGFTLGHSVTLIVAALGILTLPSRFSESMIALSIVIVAVHNLVDEAPRGRAATSTLFGLIHGFGFASALAETGLPRQGAVPALLAFNVGIELAQLAIVLVCFPALAWARRRRWFRWGLFVPACSIIAGLGSLWLVERAFDLSLAARSVPAPSAGKRGDSRATASLTRRSPDKTSASVSGQRSERDAGSSRRARSSWARARAVCPRSTSSRARCSSAAASA